MSESDRDGEPWPVAAVVLVDDVPGMAVELHLCDRPSTAIALSQSLTDRGVSHTVRRVTACHRHAAERSDP